MVSPDHCQDTLASTSRAKAFPNTHRGGQIAATDQQIDRLVYELCGLTEEEIRIVEEARP